MKLSEETHQIMVPARTLVNARRFGTDDRGGLIEVIADCIIDDARRAEDGSYYYRICGMEYLRHGVSAAWSICGMEYLRHGVPGVGGVRRNR